MKRLLQRFTPLVAALSLLGCATGPQLPALKTVEHLDLDRYMGRWNVIANIPYILEEGKVATYDTYTLRDDGWMDNNFSFRRDSLDSPEVTWHGKAKVVNTVTNAEWKVQFIWPFSAKYMVIDLDKEYQWAVVGYPDRSLLWVLARNTMLNDATYSGILQRAEKQGYDITKVKKVLQPPMKVQPSS